jgi:hypothetical protein
MTETPFAIVQQYHGLGIRTPSPYPQEFVIKTWQVSALVAALIKVVPRDASGVEQTRTNHRRCPGAPSVRPQQR